MTDREAECIRVMITCAKGGITTWKILRMEMLDKGFDFDESMAALIAIDPQILPPSPAQEGE